MRQNERERERDLLALSWVVTSPLIFKFQHYRWSPDFLLYATCGGQLSWPGGSHHEQGGCQSPEVWSVGLLWVALETHTSVVGARDLLLATSSPSSCLAADLLDTLWLGLWVRTRLLKIATFLRLAPHSFCSECCSLASTRCLFFRSWWMDSLLPLH